MRGFFVFYGAVGARKCLLASLVGERPDYPADATPPPVVLQTPLRNVDEVPPYVLHRAHSACTAHTARHTRATKTPRVHVIISHGRPA